MTRRAISALAISLLVLSGAACSGSTSKKATATTTTAARKVTTTVAGGEKPSAEFCAGKTALPEISTKLSDAATIDAKKKVLSDAATEVQKLADAAPASLKSDAQVVATGFRAYADAINAISATDADATAKANAAVADFQKVLDGPEIKRFDNVLSNNC